MLWGRDCRKDCRVKKRFSCFVSLVRLLCVPLFVCGCGLVVVVLGVVSTMVQSDTLAIRLAIPQTAYLACQAGVGPFGVECYEDYPGASYNSTQLQTTRQWLQRHRPAWQAKCAVWGIANRIASVSLWILVETNFRNQSNTQPHKQPPPTIIWTTTTFCLLILFTVTDVCLFGAAVFAVFLWCCVFCCVPISNWDCPVLDTAHSLSKL